MLNKFKSFIRELRKNRVLSYSWVATNILIIFYMVVYISIGPAINLPVPGEWLDLHGLSFLILITYSFFLLFLFVITWVKSFYVRIRDDHAILKLVGLNILFFVLALFIPIIIFVGLYIVAYFLWYVINAIVFTLFLKDISSKVSEILLKNEKIYLISNIIFWFISFGLFGFLFIAIPWMSLNVFQQMPLLLFPLFIIILPLINFILKSKTGVRPPITLFAILISTYTFYTWFRYQNWTDQTDVLTITDAILDIVMITYIYFSLFKNANKLAERLNNIISYEQLLLLFIWARISSMILLLTLSDYKLLGISASEGSYLITMFLLIVVGFILGFQWIRKGLKKEK
jgi:hypothetical protein